MPQYDLAGNPLPETNPSGSAPTRYDLAGNPMPASAPAASPYAAPNSNPNTAPYGNAAGVWPPPPSSNAYQRPTFVNTSGEAGPIPPEIARLRWNWGAFLFPAYWCRQHGLGIIAIVLIVLLIGPRFLHGSPLAGPLALLCLGIYWCARFYFGFAGHRMAWRYRRFPGGVDEHRDVQKGIMMRAFLLFFIFEGLGLILLLMASSYAVKLGPTEVHGMTR